MSTQQAIVTIIEAKSRILYLDHPCNQGWPEENPNETEKKQLEKKENFMGPKRGGSLKKVLQGGSEDEA